MARRRIARFFMYFFLSVGAIIMIFPFFWMFASAFKLPTEINKFPPQWLPSSLSLTNFEIAFSKAPFARYFLNSVIVTSDGRAMGTRMRQRKRQLLEPSMRAE